MPLFLPGNSWLTYSPTVVPGSGSITTLGTIVARYQPRPQDGICLIDLSITITTNGTGAGTLNASLPMTFNASEPLYHLTGREQNNTGKSLGCAISGSNIIIVAYDNTYPFINGSGAHVSGWFRI